MNCYGLLFSDISTFKDFSVEKVPIKSVVVSREGEVMSPLCRKMIVQRCDLGRWTIKLKESKYLTARWPKATSPLQELEVGTHKA